MIDLETVDSFRDSSSIFKPGRVVVVIRLCQRGSSVLPWQQNDGGAIHRVRLRRLVPPSWGACV